MKQKAVEEAIRGTELELGRVMRRQTWMIDALRQIRDAVERIEQTVRTHDRWERKRINGEGK